MRPATVLLGFLLFAVAGCSDSPATQPSPIAPDSPQTPTAPTATFTLTVDSLGSQEAIAGVSDVTVDASASSAAGARFEVAFGDGDTAVTSIARHIYRTAGSFTVSVTVTDAAGRKTTSTQQLVVASPLGRWVHSTFIERRKEVEVRTLVLNAQDGVRVRGVLIRDGNRTIPVTGTLTAERGIRLTLEDGSEVLEGQLPSVFSTLTSWPLTSRGNSLDGPIAFSRINGEPTGAAPDAVLWMRFFSFGAPFAVKQISPVLFDGSTSRGEELTYYLEFGDGESVTAASATHPIQKEGNYVARLTVVDRYGRSDSEIRQFDAWTLVNPGGYNEWVGYLYFSGFAPSCIARLYFKTQKGTSVSGILSTHSDYEPRCRRQRPANTWSEFTGSVDANGEVRLQLSDSSETLTGTMMLLDFTETNQRMQLTFHGGTLDGQTVSMNWRKIN